MGIDIGVNTSLPFAEQIAYLRQKVRLPTEGWQDIEGQSHDRAFVVAGAMRADLLSELHQEVIKAAESGMPLREFQKSFNSIVERKGWTELQGDDQKEYRAWRAKVIFETNMRTSHAAGRYQQMRDPEVMRLRPYWTWNHNTIENPRLLHLQWNGLTLAADDVWWATHYCPCGFGCRCTISAHNEYDLRQMGKTGPDTAPPEDYESAMWRGQVVSVPKGVQVGWDHAPGASWFPDMNQYPAPIARQLVSDNLKDGVFDRWMKRINDQVEAELKKPIFDDLRRIKNAEERDVAIKAQLRKQLGGDEQYPVAVLTDDQKKLLGVSTRVINLSNYDAVKQAYSRAGNTGFDQDAYHQLQNLVDDAKAIVRQEGNNGLMSVWVEDTKGRNYMAVIQQTKTGKGLFLKSYRLSGKNEVERAIKKGTLIYERPHD